MRPSPSWARRGASRRPTTTTGSYTASSTAPASFSVNGTTCT